VHTVHLSTLISSYNTHFADYSVGRAKVTQVIPGKVWKAVYEDYKRTFPDSVFTEDGLKVRVPEELAQLTTGTSNQGNERAELQAADVLEQLKATNNHAKRNVIRHRELIMSERINTASPAAAQTHPAGGSGNSSSVAAVKTKASILAEQSSAIVDMAADFKTTVQSRKPYLEAKMVRMRLANLKELRNLGVIDDEELKEEAKKLI
jgi:superfamily II DNA helicase RecQ